VQDLQRVLETLLASARAAGPGTPAAGDAHQAAVRAAAPLEETAAAHGKSIEVVCARGARVALEADVVERVLSPLLENAVRYAHEHVTLEIRPVAGDVVFEIRDDGPGVSPPERDTIFDPGVRGTASQTNAHAGAGLGLALARRLARAAGGEVEARASTAGGRFAVRLPAA
jgi:signal transduction histidine kinase